MNRQTNFTSQTWCEFLEAVLLWKQVAVCKCEARTNRKGPISQGNAREDAAAKKAAKQLYIALQLVLLPLPDSLTPTADLEDC